MKSTDVLILGGSAAGLVTAMSARIHWSEREITLVKKEREVMVPCGIPYIFGTLESSDKNVMPVDAAMKSNNIVSVVDEATHIDTLQKIVHFVSGEQIHYQKLVIATGSQPIKPKWLVGADLARVYTIPKDKTYLDAMKAELGSAKNIAVIGAGFIGVEMSDELVKHGYAVTLIEKLPAILNMAFDVELANKIHEMLVSRGVNVVVGKGISKVLGSSQVEAIELDDGQQLPMDAVILSMGYRPNTELAAKSGIYVDEDNFIAVDEFMRTHVPDVFAVGDCAQKRDFVTRKRVSTMLASTACAEARIAGMNLFNLNVVKTFSGTIAIYSTAIGNTGYGTAGLTEQRAEQEGIATLVGLFEGMDRHPGNLPGAHKQLVKLVSAKYSGVIIGGEVIGGLEAGELTNVIGLAIQNRMTVNDFLVMQIGTHPCLTASPAAYPLIKAAEIIAGKMMRNLKEH